MGKMNVGRPILAAAVFQAALVALSAADFHFAILGDRTGESPWSG